MKIILSFQKFLSRCYDLITGLLLRLECGIGPLTTLHLKKVKLLYLGCGVFHEIVNFGDTRFYTWWTIWHWLWLFQRVGLTTFLFSVFVSNMQHSLWLQTLTFELDGCLRNSIPLMPHRGVTSSRVLRGISMKNSGGNSLNRKIPKEVRSLKADKSVPVPKVKKEQLKKKEMRQVKSSVKGCKPIVTRSLKMKTALDGDSECSEIEEAAMSQLEKVSISGPQRRQYAAYLKGFKDFCKEQNLAWPLDSPDGVLADYCDDLFLAGQSAAVGEKTIAALEYFNLELKGKLIHAKRALKGWRKLAPPRSRLPLPRPLAMGIAMVMLTKGLREMALKLLLDFDCYLRPSESLDVLGKHIVAPVAGTGKQYQKFSVVIRDQDMGLPDKTGIFDNTLHLDHPLTSKWLGPALLQLAKAKGKDAPVFSFKMDKFREQYQRAGSLLGVPHLHTYQLRHGGASDDLNSQTRDFNQVRERGRWRTDASVRRYAKTGKIQKLLGSLNKHHLEYCEWSQNNMQNVLEGRVAARIP